MSSASEVADAWSETTFLNYCNTAAAVFMLYDYVQLTGREVESFWGRPLKAVSILFFTNKYITTTKHILDWTLPLGTTDKSCTRLFLSNFVFALLQLIPWAVFGALRTMALSRSRLLALLVLLLSFIPLGANLYLFRYGLEGQVDPLFGCQQTQRVPVPPRVSHLLTCISRASFILADLMIILITWFTLSRRHPIRPRSPLARVLLLDGTIYFVILLIFNSLQIIFTFLAIFGPGIGGASALSAFTEPVTSVLVARLLLDLQEANRQQVYATTSAAGHAKPCFSSYTTTTQDEETMVFAEGFMASLDATIMFGLSKDPDFDTERDGVEMGALKGKDVMKGDDSDEPESGNTSPTDSGPP